MSWRRLGVLIDNLPGDDLVALGLSDVPTWNWTQELLRSLVDAVRENTWVTQAVVAAKKDRMPFPETFPRPWEETKEDIARKRRANMRAQLLAQRERIRKERAAVNSG